MADEMRAGGVESAEAEARWIVQAVDDSEGDDAALEMMRRRIAGEPLQYVLGCAAFRRLELAVGPGVFIPRPETELVAERAMKRLPRDGIVVDLCSGSGAIALSIADERPDARVFATERSRRALEWAVRNREAHGLDVTLCEGDLFEGLPQDLSGRVDVVVANPPYVDEAETSLVARDVIENEPADALFAPGRGTSVIERIVAAAPEWLRQEGWLVTEIGETQGAAAGDLLRSAGYADVDVLQDLTGRDRIAEGRAAR
ncbi:MAG: peptide chain release factor N(5)-glutamine methyltransferase [Actinomycetota bacterium]|nr:peptide chain release factor N(5)-glutamine methyltransferase [Actinomycetota bacterium]